MNKIIFLALILAISCVHSEYIPTTFGLFTIESQYTVFNASTAAFIGNTSYPDIHYDLSSVLATDADSQTITLLAQGVNTWLVEYSITNNSFIVLSEMKKSISYAIAAQRYAYDAAHKIVAVVGATAVDSAMVINIWNFAKKTIDVVPLNIPYLAPPVGCYDDSTGHYYITYTDKNSMTHLAIFNLLTKKMVSKQIMTLQSIRPVPIYNNGQMVLVDTRETLFLFYSVDLSDLSYKLFLKIPFYFPQNIMIVPIATYGDYAIIISSTQTNNYEFTTLNLNTLEYTNSPNSNLTMPIFSPLTFAF
ncbi:hypothetical protein PPL_11314 [Heterostelium album PN500]|uniref:Uncharacterized protein n=1 Tax=Heterostelium pallidum (strain ATCC 26659 / Pp 5 / PN500) TaxID=670386 RepID=D3BT22_HETP5|nr:hypothetical protein PPL_11314 [Heterostelium album PN500]EFA75239.1 hypothetical protein PPL_11314 [Heterostelium album PN500]|eukprot:XP_020427373.1 hypothetical protein PPL_11314 [Heterostelium album PN500]